jgi:hypothetical protein
MEKQFINEDILTKIYSKIIQTLKIKPSPDQKNQIVKLIYGTMKKVFANMNRSKITPANFDKAIRAYMEKNVEKSLEEIKKFLTSDVSQMSERQFQRDQDLYGGRKVNVDNRAKPSDAFMIDNKNIKKNNYDSQFQPIVKEPTVDDRNSFYYSNSKNNDGKLDTSNALEQLKKMRDIDIPAVNQKPRTPEWILNGRERNTKRPDQNQNMNEIMKTQNNLNNAQNGHGDISGFGFGDETLNAFNDSNFGLSITNGVDDSFDDNTKFEDRLKKLQQQRENIDTNIEQFINKQQPQHNPNNSNNFKYNNNNVNNIDDDDIEKQLLQFQIKKNKDEEREYQLKQLKMMEKQKQESMNEDYLEMVKKNQKYIEKIQELKNTNDELYSEIKLLKQELNNVESQKTEELKKTFIPKLNEYKKLINEVNEKSIEIKQRENILIEKEYKMKQLIQQYESSLNVKTYQIVINSKLLGENFDEYIFPLQMELTGVIKFSLSSYNIPEPKYNIEDHNNIFEYEINSEIKKIFLKIGAYNINRLIENLNKNSDLKFSINDDQHIVVSSDENFKIIKTILSFNVLGFKQYNNDNDNKTYIADELWDLRFRDHIILQVSDICEEDFLCCLTYNGKSDSLIEFDSPISIDKLKIKFVDSDGYKIKFYNQHHILIFRAECIKEDLSNIYSKIEEVNFS